MVTIIVAMGKNREIGKENQLLWRLPDDLKHFKDLTAGHPVIMGRKTYESIGRPLPNRTNIVVSGKKDWFEEGILVVESVRNALKHAQKIDENIFVIGGGKIYEQTMEMADRLEITQVDVSLMADTFFPEIDFKKWKLIQETCREKDERNAYSFCFQTYEKRN
ncbi:MAG: dihydrofolate reductase [Bergeyella sp.]|nr:dihydrofolate reductase [Bergeyella sp.]